MNLADSVIGWLRDSRAGQAIAEKAETERAAAELEQQHARVQQLDAVKAEEARVMPPLRDAVEDHRRRVAAAEEQLRQEQVALHEAEAEALVTSAGFDHRRSVVERELIAKAPAMIQDAIREFDRSLDEMRYAITSREVIGPLEIRQVVTNAAAVQTRTNALRTARAAAEALKLRALTASELEAELDQIRSTVPALEDLREDADPLFAA
jgi:hypothetical protein